METAHKDLTTNLHKNRVVQGVASSFANGASFTVTHLSDPSFLRVVQLLSGTLGTDMKVVDDAAYTVTHLSDTQTKITNVSAGTLAKATANILL